MNKHWKKHIKSQLKDFPKKAPEGLFADIQSEMHRRGLNSAPVTLKPLQSHTVFYRISVASFLLLLLGFSYLWTEKAGDIIITEKNNLPTEIIQVPPTQVATIEKENNVIQPINKTTKTVIAKSGKTNPSSTKTPSAKEEHNIEVEEEDIDTLTNDTKELLLVQKQKGEARQQSKQTYTLTRKKENSIALGVYYSGIMTKEEKEYTYGSNSPTTKPEAGTEINDSTTTESRSLNHAFSRIRNKEKAKHHLPLKFGFTFRYYLNELWNIQSGLTYSYLATDLSYNGLESFYQTEQKLHYIGIPVQVGLRIWEGKRLRGYTSIGAQVEKLVSGKATTHYTLGDHSSGNLTEDISDRNLLFSVLGSIGAEYMLKKNLSLYAEPGIHYYFKNGSNLQTYYTEHPLNFNITIGLRFHWNKE